MFVAFGHHEHDGNVPNPVFTTGRSRPVHDPLRGSVACGDVA